MRIITTGCIVAALLGLAACGDTTEQRAATGAIGGAVAGTAVGAPLVGGAAGAAVGAATK